MFRDLAVQANLGDAMAQWIVMEIVSVFYLETIDQQICH